MSAKFDKFDEEITSDTLAFCKTRDRRVDREKERRQHSVDEIDIHICWLETGFICLRNSDIISNILIPPTRK